jgi:hypothetical protein
VANERTLKVLCSVLGNTASDCETLFRLLDSRAYERGSKVGFSPAPIQLPMPPFPGKSRSAAIAVTYAKALLQDYVSVLGYFNLAPSTANPVNPSVYGENGLLHLITEWQSLRGGIIKLMVTQYGGHAVDPPRLYPPGSASEDRLWAEVAVWLQKLEGDVNSFLSIQGITPGHVPPLPVPTPNLIDSMVDLEQTFHQATLDAMLIVSALPYHLYHAAHR